MVLLLYESKHGHTLKVAKYCLEKFNFTCDLANISDAIILDNYNLVLFFSPTYGDEELPLSMEDFLLTVAIRNKRFIVCELGNYYGYDVYEFGAGRIIRNFLLALDWVEICQMLSLDSLPRIDWESLDMWIEGVNDAVSNYS